MAFQVAHIRSRGRHQKPTTTDVRIPCVNATTKNYVLRIYDVFFLIITTALFFLLCVYFSTKTCHKRPHPCPSANGHFYNDRAQ